MRMHRSSRSPRSRHQPSQSPAGAGATAGGRRHSRWRAPRTARGYPRCADRHDYRPAAGAERLPCATEHAPGDVGVAAVPSGGRAHRTAAKAMDGSIDTLAALIAMVGNAVAHVFHRFDVPLLAVGLVLHLTADLVRNRGWFGVLRAVGPEHGDLRARDVQAAAFAGGSVNAFVPARAGDLVKLAVLRRRLPESRMPTLMATLAPETLFEWFAGALLLSWALALGYMPTSIAVDALAGAADHPVTAAVVAT